MQLLPRIDLRLRLRLPPTKLLHHRASPIQPSLIRIFADEVTGVAREVGIEGKLGAQAKVPGAAGTCRDHTDNENQLAGNLTSPVRAIAEVSTAVPKGDLTRSITVEAQG